MELESNQQPFQGPQRRQADENRQRSPEQRVHPQRRRVGEFSDERCPSDDRTGDEDNEDGRTVACVRGSEVETARFASGPDLEKAGKQPSFAATRAAPG